MLAIVEAPLLGAEGEALKKLPYDMPDEYEMWLDAQLFSAKASQQYTNYKDVIFPLERAKTKQTLDTMWRYVNLVRNPLPPRGLALTDLRCRTTKPCLASISTLCGIWRHGSRNKHHSSTVTISPGRTKKPRRFPAPSLPGPRDRYLDRARRLRNNTTKCPNFNRCPNLQRRRTTTRAVNGRAAMIFGTRMIGTRRTKKG